jgi:hypothetical protein
LADRQRPAGGSYRITNNPTGVGGPAAARRRPPDDYLLHRRVSPPGTSFRSIKTIYEGYKDKISFFYSFFT